ncbi:tetratricopeptide repeat-containing protein [Nocardia sp. NPDC050697]|uniref:tetratricopeptide repeat-containing protein n=1 Tax=Nocardia sp. NPDC050697 TaxID=3155158 RepID=UPI0033D01A80
MPFRGRKSKTTHQVAGEFGSAEINVVEQRGKPTSIDITVSLSAVVAGGLDFQHKRTELGLQHPETLHALHRYAHALGDLPEKRGDAIELLEWLVDAGAVDLENKLLALNDLTRLLQDSGSLSRAEQRLREALSGWERLCGQDDPETLGTATNLAVVLLGLDRGVEAEGLMRDTVARCTRTLGATHPDTLRSRHTLAGALRGSPARLAEAERMYRALLTDIDDITDPVAFVTRSNLAAVLMHRGKSQEALSLYRDSIDARSRQQGDDHPDTWAARQNLAVVQAELGHVIAAETQLTEVLAAYRRIHGPRHADTLGAQVNLAITKANRGRGAEAIPLLRDAIEGYRSTHGPGHPLVRELLGILAALGG